MRGSCGRHSRCGVRRATTRLLAGSKHVTRSVDPRSVRRAGALGTAEAARRRPHDKALESWTPFLADLPLKGVRKPPAHPQAGEAPPPAPLWRKLQAKMNIEFCSKNIASELEPCKVLPCPRYRSRRSAVIATAVISHSPFAASSIRLGGLRCSELTSSVRCAPQSQVFQESLKGLSLEEKRRRSTLRSPSSRHARRRRSL